jgi:hypothetical protein
VVPVRLLALREVQQLRRALRVLIVDCLHLAAALLIRSVVRATLRASDESDGRCRRRNASRLQPVAQALGSKDDAQAEREAERQPARARGGLGFRQQREELGGDGAEKQASGKVLRER